jgi:hypothetical protein
MARSIVLALVAAALLVAGVRYTILYRIWYVFVIVIDHDFLVKPLVSGNLLYIYINE